MSLVTRLLNSYDSKKNYFNLLLKVTKLTALIFNLLRNNKQKNFLNPD